MSNLVQSSEEQMVRRFSDFKSFKVRHQAPESVPFVATVLTHLGVHYPKGNEVLVKCADNFVRGKADFPLHEAETNMVLDQTTGVVFLLRSSTGIYETARPDSRGVHLARRLDMIIDPDGDVEEEIGIHVVF